jgi:hypothetical protein
MGQRPQNKNSATRIKAERREAQVMEMHLADMTGRQIARKLKITPGRVSQIISKAVKRFRGRNAETYDAWVTKRRKQIQVAIRAIWPQVKDGKHVAILDYVRLVELDGDITGWISQRPVVQEITNVNILAKIEAYTKELGGGLAAGPKALPCLAEGNGGGEPVDSEARGADVQAKSLPGL